MQLADINALLDDGMPVYRHYIHEEVRLKKKIISPLRPQERDPSFALYRSRNGNVMFSDFGMPLYGNAWDFVIALHDNCTFAEALALVKKEVLGLGESGNISDRIIRLQSQPRVREKQTPPAIIKPAYRPWRASDLTDFARFGISRPTMERFQFFPVEKYLLDKGEEDQRWVIYEKPGNPIYAIQINGRFKMYRPHEKDKKRKWMSNVLGDQDFFGYDQLPATGDSLFIMAGNKDTMSFAENIQLPCLPLNSEQAHMDLRLLTDLRCRFQRIYTLYDDDPTGNRAATKMLHDYGFQPRNQPIKNAGVNDFALLMEQLLPYPAEVEKLRAFYYAQ